MSVQIDEEKTFVNLDKLNSIKNALFKSLFYVILNYVAYLGVFSDNSIRSKQEEPNWNANYHFNKQRIDFLERKIVEGEELIKKFEATA